MRSPETWGDCLALVFRAERKRAGLTQAAAAQRANTAQSTISRMETGEMLVDLYVVANLFGSVDAFLAEVREVAADSAILEPGCG